MLAFSDGVFAIAMTLLVVGITVPISDGDSVNDLADALNDLTPNFVSFFISFAVIGRYWAAHHRFLSRGGGQAARHQPRLSRRSSPSYRFQPRSWAPTSRTRSRGHLRLCGRAHQRSRSASPRTLTAAVSCGRRCLRTYFAWGVIQSTLPVVYFLVSVPVAFLSTTVAVCVWFLGLPFGIVANRRKPPDADRFF